MALLAGGLTPVEVKDDFDVLELIGSFPVVSSKATVVDAAYK